MQNVANTQDGAFFFAEIVNDYKPLTISAKQVHPRCLQRSATTSEYVYL